MNFGILHGYTLQHLFLQVMSLKRRDFLRSIAATSVVAGAGSGIIKGAQPEPLSAPKPVRSPSPLPARLERGARVGVASPASGVTKREMKGFFRMCESYGFEPVLGRNINHRDGYLSAPDQDRADEFMAFIEDPTIDAIICGRGGYGVMRILPMLDYGAIGQANKMIMGFSDITSLLIAANQLSGIVTYHGPVASSTFDPFTIDSFRQTVLAGQPEGGSTAGEPDPEVWSFSDERLTTIQTGHGRGRLTGGNLAMIVATLGTAYEIDTQGAILFLEEINEEPYRIDRMLTQLWLAGKLQSCAGIALGNFKNCEAKGISISGPSFTLREVIEERTKDLGIPVVYGLPFGHVKSKLTLPVGMQAELDATNKRLRLLRG